MSGWTEHEDGLFAEHQGPFAPEQLPDVAEPTVFSRRFTNDEEIVDIYASPVIPDQFIGLDDVKYPFDVLVCTETRKAGDESGDTSEYEWQHVNYVGLTLEKAIEEARSYVSSIEPERDL